MLQCSGQLFTQALNALLFAVCIGLAIGLAREPTSSAFVLRGEPAATAGALKRVSTASSTASQVKPKAPMPIDPPSELKCRIGLASCRKWRSLQERKGQPLVHSAQR
jgi:hypothetical protein